MKIKGGKEAGFEPIEIILETARETKEFLVLLLATTTKSIEEVCCNTSISLNKTLNLRNSIYKRINKRRKV